MLAGISLANKCQLLFGCAVVLILAAALSVPWVRTRLLVDDFQIELARQVADAWMADRIQLGTLTPAGIFPGALDVDALESETEHDANGDGQAEVGRIPALRMSFVWVEDLDPADPDRPFLAEAYHRFRADPTETDGCSLAISPAISPTLCVLLVASSSWIMMRFLRVIG